MKGRLEQWEVEALIWAVREPEPVYWVEFAPCGCSRMHGSPTDVASVTDNRPRAADREDG